MCQCVKNRIKTNMHLTPLMIELGNYKQNINTAIFSAARLVRHILIFSRGGVNL